MSGSGKPSSPLVLVYGALMTQTVISAGTFLFAKRALDEVPPLALAMVRFTGAAILFALLVLAWVRPVLPPRIHWKRLGILALLGVPLNQGLLMSGLSRSTPAHAALLYTLTPAVVLVLSSIAGAERPRGRKLVGLLLALSGAATVVLVRGGPANTAAPSTLVGDLLILGAVLAWGAYTAYGKSLVQEVGPIASSGWGLVLGTLFFLPIGVPASVGVDWSAVSATAWWSVGYLIVFTSVIAYLCWYYALRSLEPSRVAIFTNLQPVGTAALSWALFGERITWPLVVGGVLVIVGVFVTTRPDAKHVLNTETA